MLFMEEAMASVLVIVELVMIADVAFAAAMLVELAERVERQ